MRVTIPSIEQLAPARHAVYDALSSEPLGAQAEDVAVVVGELLAAAYESGVRDAVIVSVERFPRVISVRVRSAERLRLHDGAFQLREHVLHRVALAFGERQNADGTTDLWAEVASVRAEAP